MGNLRALLMGNLSTFLSGNLATRLARFVPTTFMGHLRTVLLRNLRTLLPGHQLALLLVDGPAGLSRHLLALLVGHGPTLLLVVAFFDRNLLTLLDRHLPAFFFWDLCSFLKSKQFEECKKPNFLFQLQKQGKFKKGQSTERVKYHERVKHIQNPTNPTRTRNVKGQIK